MLDNYQRVYAAIDLDAVRHNMEQMHQNLSVGTKIMGVIKTDGYGHGAVPIGRELEGIPYVSGYAVATAEEAFMLRNAGLKKPILILGYTFPYSYDRKYFAWTVQRNLPPVPGRLAKRSACM